MVISFEEKDRAAIESQGITIIEFKRNLHRMETAVSKAWGVIEDAAEKIKKAWNCFKNALLEAIDKRKMYIEVMRDIYGYHTSLRYRIVKMISKCTGIDQYKVWNMTRHTWLARCSI